jgi:hypothetical protein
MKSLRDLQAEGLPHCQIEDVMKVTEGQDKELALIAEHLHKFVPPQNCISCDAQLEGFFGCFEWGLVHGEGHCTECGYPARAYHRINDDKGEMLSFTYVLQYHPDSLKEKS